MMIRRHNHSIERIGRCGFTTVRQEAAGAFNCSLMFDRSFNNELFRQTNASNQILKPRVVAQWIHEWVDL